MKIEFRVYWNYTFTLIEQNIILCEHLSTLEEEITFVL